MTVALLAAAAFVVGALWRETLWRWGIGGSLGQIRARRAARLEPPAEASDTRGPVVDFSEVRRRRRAFDARIGGRQ